MRRPPANRTCHLRPAISFSGQVDLDHGSKRLTVTLKDIDGQSLFSQELTPGARW